MGERFNAYLSEKAFVYVFKPSDLKFEIIYRSLMVLAKSRDMKSVAKVGLTKGLFGANGAGEKFFSFGEE